MSRNSGQGLLPLLTVLALCSLCTVPSMGRQRTSKRKGAVHITHMKAIQMNGHEVDLASQKGWKVLYFWSSTCPCVQDCETFSLKPLARKYRNRVTFFAIASSSFDLEMPENVFASHVKFHNLPFPVVRDNKHGIMDTLGALVTPQTFLLTPDNRVVFAGMPDDSRIYRSENGKTGYRHAILAQALRQALAGKPIRTPAMELQGCLIGR